MIQLWPDKQLLRKNKKSKNRNRKFFRGETLTCGSLTYTVTEDDYFVPGCKTILSNEKAAIVVVEKIYQELKKNNIKKFIDKDFGPTPDDEHGRMSM